jgi:hypothetical protein
VTRTHRRDPVAVLGWLVANPVPAGPSPAWTRWRARAEVLGKDAIPVLLHALEFAPPDVQDTAQQALRTIGVEVWAHGYGRDLRYRISRPGRKPVEIRPLLPDVSLLETLPGIPARVEEPTSPYGDDPFARIGEAGRAIESLREQMGALGRIRSETVRELLEAGISRAEIARRLGVHPNYVNQLAKGARGH